MLREHAHMETILTARSIKRGFISILQRHGHSPCNADAFLHTFCHIQQGHEGHNNSVTLVP